MRAEQQAAIRERRAQAELLGTQAVERGDEGAFQQVFGIMQAQPGLFRPDLMKAFQAATPEAKARREFGEMQAEFEAEQAGIAADRQREAQRESDRRNRQGMANLGRGRTRWERERKEEEKALEPEGLARGAEQFLKQQQAARQEALAGRIFRGTGGQFTEEQSRHAAGEALKLQAAGLNQTAALGTAVGQEFMLIQQNRQKIMQTQMQIEMLRRGLGNAVNAQEGQGAPQGAAMVGP
jgi:hypothetical protein